MKAPRILLAAGASGSGKTLITCGLLQALRQRALKLASFKCGPDYIDPMFHSRVIGTKSRNLDTFFTDDETTRFLFCQNAKEMDLSVMEGVMGYYDGLGGVSTAASAYDLARVTDTPVILIVNSRGMSVSLAAYLKGFLTYREDSRIRGVILNQMSAMLYPRMRELIERELPVEVLGYVPVMEDFHLESRHLGLVLPEEVADLQRQLEQLAATLEETLDIDRIVALAKSAPDISGTDPLEKTEEKVEEEAVFCPRIAVARDDAFCFLYEDNLDLLRRFGADLIYFSPLHDEKMPEAEGLLLCGGYPELHAKQLSDNRSMRESIAAAVRDGMPTLAECGGFMYLQQRMEDMQGESWPMAGALDGAAYRTPRLGRFGYITLSANRADQLFGTGAGEIRGHEFHYFDSTNCGSAFHAAKPLQKRGWECIQGSPSYAAGFPHLYFYSNPKYAQRFVEACGAYGRARDRMLSRSFCKEEKERKNDG